MAGENSGDLGRRRYEVGLARDLIISPTSQKLQTVGQRILSNRKILEVAENVFSTCQVPFEELSDRLLVSRPFGAPLVEATVLPHNDLYASMRQQFGVIGRLVEGITWSDGKQRRNRHLGYHMRYDRMALDLEKLRLIEGHGDSGAEIQAYFTSAYYSIEDGRRYVLGKSHEKEVAYGFLPTDDPRLDEQLDRAFEELERFDAAVMTPDGYWQ